MKKLLVIALAVLMVFVSSCSKSTPINFKKVASASQGNDINYSYHSESGMIKIISSNLSFPREALLWVTHEDHKKILEVDYSEYFVLAAFNGFRTNIYTKFNIERISINNNTILVTAHFNEYDKSQAMLAAYSSSYEVVKINWNQIPQKVPITFKLLDEKGKERARTTYDFQKTENPKMDWGLNQLVQAKRTEWESIASQHGLKLKDDKVDVTIYFVSGQGEIAAKAVTDVGGELTSSTNSGVLFSAFVPITKLESLANENSISYIEISDPGVLL